MTKEGKVLNFKPVSKNKKRTFPSQERFPQYNDWQKVTGKFLGPGTYNDNEAFKMIKAVPCQSVYKQHSIGRDAGRPCFIMIGNNMTYEPSFENNSVQKQMKRAYIDDKTGVSSMAAFGKTSLASLKKANHKLNVTTLSNTSFINRRSIENEYNGTSDSIIAGIQEANQNRPQTSYNVIRPISQNTMNQSDGNIIAQGAYNLTSQSFISSQNNLGNHYQQQTPDQKQVKDSPEQNSSFNPKASISTKTSSQYGRRLVQSQARRHRPNQASQSLMAETNTNESDMMANTATNDLLRPLTEMNPNGRQRVYFAKTAQNFYNLAKGYWRPGKKTRKQKIEQQIQKQINILSAYGEYNNFKSYQQQFNQQVQAARPKSQNQSSLAIQPV